MSIQRWHDDGRCFRDSEGEWVTYSDHVNEIEKVRAEERERARVIAKESLREYAKQFEDWDYYSFAKELWKETYHDIANKIMEWKQVRP